MRGFVTFWVLSGLLLWAALSEAEGAARKAETRDAQGVTLELRLGPPTLESVQARDGGTYTKVRAGDAGTDNAPGLPALPVFVETVEIPLGIQPEVSVEESDLQEAATPHWVYPHQPPAPKNGVETPFVIDEPYYRGEKAAGPAKSAAASEPVVRTYVKRGRAYASVELRPFAYDPVKGVLQYPTALRLTLTYPAAPLPKAAGPRTGTIHLLEVRCKTDAEWRALVEDGYDVASRQGLVLKIYATDAELLELQQAGHEIVELSQPDVPASGKALGQYHDYAGMVAALNGYAQTYPTLCTLESIGKSVQNRELYALKISDNPNADENEPETAYVGNIHGNERPGLELCMYFIDYLLSRYTTDSRVRALVNDFEIWVMPSMNPDGLEASTRANANGIDLNRIFPDGATSAIGNVLDGPPPVLGSRPIEVQRVIEWCMQRRFAVMANFHTGALVVNYPYDNDGLGSVYSTSPDDALFQQLSRTYSSRNTPMWNSTVFANGITNGADWYSVEGGFQDWAYRYLGALHVTIEVSNTFVPAASQLPTLWSNNRDAMLAYLEAARTGINGIVTNAASGNPLAAKISVQSEGAPVYTGQTLGDYHRPLLSGTYTVTISAPGFLPQTFHNVTVSDGVSTTLNAALTSDTAPAGLVVVYPTPMASAAAAYVQQKQTEGFEVFTLPVEPATPASAIRAQLQTLYAQEAPAYVVIIGDIESIPTFYAGSVLSDLPYALMDPGEDFEDFLGKDLVVGRISLDSASAVSQYVQKIGAFARARKHGKMVWVSNGNNESEWSIAEGSHEWVIANAVPAGVSHERFFRKARSAAELTSVINGGVDTVVYSGHGAWNMWSGYSYSVVQLASLANALDVPVVFGHCCQTGAFQNDDCFAEAWLETTARGVAYVAGSADTFWNEDDVLERREFAALQTNPDLGLGQALEVGLEHVYAAFPGSGQTYYTRYHVFGDPTVAVFPRVLTITSPLSLPAAYRNQTYSFTLTATHGVAPLAWSVASGTLPAGLVIDGERIEGTPTESGTFTFTIQVTDALQTTAQQTVTLEVFVPLQITSPAVLPPAYAESAYSHAFTATGGSTPYAWGVKTGSDYAELTTAGGWLGGGTAQGWRADDSMWQLVLPWPFPFYGQTYSKLYVSSNGYIDFALQTAQWDNSVTELKKHARIAPLWDDLKTNQTGGDVYLTVNEEYVAIRWRAASYQNTAMSVDVEAVLYRDGRIAFHYGSALTGLSPTIGISSGDGTHYLLSARDASASIGAGSASLWTCSGLLPEGLTLSTDGQLSGTPTTPGLYTFSAAVSDSGAPTQTRESLFTLEVHPASPVHLGFTAFPASGRAPLNVAFNNASVSTSEPIENWTWDFGDGQSSSDWSPTHVYAEAGVYDVTLTAYAGGVAYTLTKQQFIIVQPPAGALQIMLLLDPADPFSYGGKWCVDGGPWQESQAILEGLTPGSHTVSYQLLPNAQRPPAETVTIVSKQTTVLTRAYTPGFDGALEDVNQDGYINVADVQLIINDLIGLDDVPTADVDRSGAVNVKDIQRVINIILGLAR